MQLRMKVSTLFGFLMILLIASCAPADVRPQKYTMVVSGAVERDLSGGAIYYEEIPHGRQIYIQKNGPRDAICVLTIELAADLPPGDYAVSAEGPVAAGYYEAVDGVSRVFNTDIRGVLTVEESGDSFRGSLDITAGSPAVEIQGSFHDVPSESALAAKEAAAEEADAEAAKAALHQAVRVFASVLVVVMVLTSLAFQFYVGWRIYAGRTLALLLILNPTGVYLRGWRDPRIRRVMNGWTLVILATLMFVCLLAVVYDVGK